MKIYTGYFAKLKLYKEKGLIPISIALKNPDWYIGHTCSYFAPSYDLLSRYKKNEIDSDKYTIIYLNQLDKNIVHTKLTNIKTKCENKPIIFLCYEKPSDFCHRHLLAKYIKDNFNVNVQEYTE